MVWGGYFLVWVVRVVGVRGRRMDSIKGDGDRIFHEQSIFFVIVVTIRDLIKNFYTM